MVYVNCTKVRKKTNFIFLNCNLSSGIHVQSMQVYYTGIHVPWWFAATMNPSSTLGISPNAVLFNCYFAVRTCSLWFSVPVLVCWECWFPASSMSLQRTFNSSFFMAAYYSMLYMCHIFPIQSIISGHLGWFQVFAIVNSAAMNIRVHVSL